MAASPPPRPVLRWLRIALAAGFGLACCLFAALWLRNFWRDDLVIVGDLGGDRAAVIYSCGGFISFELSSWPPKLPRLPDLTEIDWQTQSAVKRNGVPTLWRPSLLRPMGGYDLWIPLWIPVATTGSLGMLVGARTWRTRRFSMHTLLVATTLLVLLLGAIVATSRFMPAYVP